ncbi:uncharacterized protein LOC122295781 [Carya illinoinensis]|uniref:uncharacterized protein LOC122295781 n=1 Tax=Carya illinoinensis TaxID=32201 RepID=UPI001C726CE5|nr:uncharacterized protein LOC122295781 [Carya illinoinensis]
MSVPDNEIFNAIGTGGGVQSRDAEDDDDDDDDDDSGKKQRGDRHGVGRGDGGCTRYFTKAKLVVLRPFTKAKKQLLRKMNKRTSSSSRSAAENAGTSDVSVMFLVSLNGMDYKLRIPAAQSCENGA